MKEGVLRPCAYGRIQLHLKELMDQRGINRNQMAKWIDTRFEVVNKWYEGSVEKLDLDILARLCYVLECQTGDLIEYQEPAPEDYKN